MGSHLITIASFPDSIEANIVKSKLESEGIECFMQSGMASDVIWRSSNVAGNLNLQVNEEDVEKAKEILNRHLSIDENTELIPDETELDSPEIKRPSVCPVCSSSDIIEKPDIIFVAFFTKLFNISKKQKSSQVFICRNCEYKWKN